MTIWFKDLGSFSAVGILDESTHTKINGQNIYEFETGAYSVMTNPRWLEEDDWEYIGEL